jgi:hypothetical protein
MGCKAHSISRASRVPAFFVHAVQAPAQSSSKKSSSTARSRKAAPAAALQPREECKMVLCVNTSLGMGKGKIGKHAGDPALFLCLAAAMAALLWHIYVRIACCAAASVCHWAGDLTVVTCCNSYCWQTRLQSNEIAAGTARVPMSLVYLAAEPAGGYCHAQVLSVLTQQ